MKVLLLLLAVLLASCRNASVKEEKFTITEHTAATDSHRESYIIKHESGNVVTVLKATCSYTLYDNKTPSLSGFCPLERLPNVGQSVARCSERSQMGAGSPPCMSHAGDFLIIHEGGLWGNDAVGLTIESESVKH
jgi:hypothetical protein